MQTPAGTHAGRVVPRRLRVVRCVPHLFPPSQQGRVNRQLHSEHAVYESVAVGVQRRRPKRRFADRSGVDDGAWREEIIAEANDIVTLTSDGPYR